MERRVTLMELAKPRIDIGLSTNALDPMLSFWREEAGVRFDHLLKIRRGHDQHRHDANGSVVKINHHAAALPDNPLSGYSELIIAKAGLREARALVDPDGNRVRLVPSGDGGVTQIGVRLAVRDLSAHNSFYRDILGLNEEASVTGTAFRAGESLIILEQTPDAPSDAQMAGPGWRYITFQVFKVDQEHARVLAAGGREAMAPITLGATARISMIRDPDGNWIELSQRASIVGSLT
jgi:catechol 2,3-dioxygenase-like lactoylglutathione lyase family enzyme